MNISLNYIERGQGYPLILLHGNGEDHTYFQSQIEYFSKTRRVIAIDMRGRGGSPMGTKPFSLYTFAEDLYDFMKYHHIYKADILGFSDGGNIALIFALKYQSMVRKLILNGANLNFFGMTPIAAADILVKYILYCIQAPFSRKAAKNKALYGLMVKEPMIDPESLSVLEIPVMVIVGDDDVIRSCHSELIKRSIANCQLVSLKGGHYIAEENSREFNRAVEAFLRDPTPLT